MTTDWIAFYYDYVFVYGKYILKRDLVLLSAANSLETECTCGCTHPTPDKILEVSFPRDNARRCISESFLTICVSEHCSFTCCTMMPAADKQSGGRCVSFREESQPLFPLFFVCVRLFSGIEPEMLDVGNQRLAQCANERTQLQDVEKDGLLQNSGKSKNTGDTKRGQKAIN